MNILIVTGKMDEGGAETHVFELARTLSEAGHAVTVASAGGRLAKKLCTLGISHLDLPLDKKSPHALIECRNALVRLAKQRNFHIIHAHTRISAAVAWRVSRAVSVRLVTTIHARFRMNAPWGWLSRWGDSVIAVSQDLGQYLLCRGGVLAENITVIPNGIDTERFSPAYGVSERVRRVVFLSRLDGDCSSAAYALCRISERLEGAIPDIQIIIAGGGSELDSVRGLAEKKNYEAGKRTVCVVGKVDGVPELLRNADIFVGVSRAALEAMSCGVPTVIAGDEGFLGALGAENIRKARQSNFCGRGSGRLTDDRLFEAISTLAKMTREQRRALGGTLREFVAAEHSLENVRELTEKVYSSTYRPKKTDKGSILLCGYYGYGNMGDDLLLVRAIERAEKKYPRTPIRALTANGKRDTRKFGVTCVRRIDPLALIREIRRAKTVVFGGGTLLQNGTSRRSLWYYLLVLRYAQRLGKRTELWGNGLGRIEGRYARRMTARSLAGCELVGLRDRDSVCEAVRLLDEHGLKRAHIALEDDLALKPFAENSARMDYLTSELCIDSSSRIAVVAFRGSEDKERIASMERWVAALCKEGILPVYIVMYPAEDMALCQRIRKRLGGVVAYPVGAGDIVGLMRRARVVCGMRYHALVLAYLAGVPFIGFGSEPKIERFCRSHGGRYADG